MTDKDKKIRKLWLISYFVITLSNIIYSQFQLKEDHVPSPVLFFASFISVLFFTFLFLYIYYRCAYKKPGTKLLTFTLICSTIFFILNPILLFQGKISIPHPTIYWVQFAASLYIYQLTWTMRSINKTLQSDSKG